VSGSISMSSLLGLRFGDMGSGMWDVGGFVLGEYVRSFCSLGSCLICSVILEYFHVCYQESFM